MIDTIRALVSKELQQHRAVFFWLAAFTALVTWLLFRIAIAGGQILSYLSITSIFAIPALVIIAFFVGQRLVAAEFYGQTQRFIEALPIRPGYVQWVKYWLGYLGLLFLLICVWLACIAVAQHSESIRPVFLALMAVRLSAFVFAMWSVVFTFSLLGRLRIPLIAGAVVAVMLIDSFTQFEVSRFGPLALMDNDLFAFERRLLPTRHLIETLTFGAVVLSIGMWLARLRDGSLVETLATPVTARAKGFLVALAVITIGIYSYFGPEPEIEPFAYTSHYVARDGAVEIAYLYPEFEEDAERLLHYFAERSQALDAILPPTGDGFRIRVSFDPAADPTEFDTVLADHNQGVVVSANFEPSTEWDSNFFGAYVFHHVVAAKKDGRLYLEPLHWLLDGFARWWAAYGDQPTDTADTRVDLVMLEALYATRNSTITERLLQDWDITSEEYGESAAMSIAYSGFRILQEQRGTPVALKLAQQEFSRPTYGDVRDWWSDWRDPFPQRFARATGWPWTEFVEEWDRRLNELRASPRFSRALDGIAKGELTIAAELGDLGTRSIRYSLQFDRPLPANTKCVALHSALPHFDFPIGRSMLRETVVFWPGSTGQDGASSIDYRLEGEYGQGTRVFAAFECQLPQFPTPQYLGHVRITMP